MDAVIKETVKAVGLQTFFDSFSPEMVEKFFDYAVMVWARGKSGAVANASQLPFFSIHLSCLKNSVTLDAAYLQKKSSLNPKAYQSGLQSLLQAVDPADVINPEIVARYYGCPSMAALISDLQSKCKDFSPSCTLAAAHLIGQKTKLSKALGGTMAELSPLWAQPLDHIKSAASDIKPLLDGIDWKEKERLLTEELKEAQRFKSAQLRSASQRPSATAAKRSLNSSPTKSNTKTPSNPSNCPQSSSIHPLLLFNCSCSGPAFGPLIYN